MPPAAPRAHGPLDPGVTGIPEGYHTLLAPRLIEPWTPTLLARLPLPPGARVLDLACGSGIVARALPDHARVVGADAWDAMTALARRDSPTRIAWTTADFHRLPFRDAAFDALACQQALQFADDLHAALTECRRVLRPGGHAAFATWADLPSSPGFATLRDQLARHWGPDAAPGAAMPFSLDDAHTLRHALATARFTDVHVERHERHLHFDNPTHFLHAYIAGSYLLETLPTRTPEAQQSLLAGVHEALAPWTGPHGLRFPIACHITTATANESA